MGEKVVLAYSGGLDTSVIVHWLAQKGYEVIAAAVDVGQKPDLDLEEKATSSGAKKFVLKDMKKEFVEKGVFQCLKAEAKYEGRYLLGTAIARPFITKALVEVAEKEGTNKIAHGATGKGNDQCRFELTAYALMPDAEIIAPWRIEEFRSLVPGRQEAIAYAKKHGIPIEATSEKPYSCDENLAHKSNESGILEKPGREAPEHVYKMLVSPEKAPDSPELVSIGFEDGIPVSVEGKKMEPVALMEKLNQVGGKHGIGILDMVENRFVGMKSRGVYEAPAATILYEAHRDLEGLTMDRNLMHLRDSLAPHYAALVYYGFWCSRELQALNAFVDASQKGVTGQVKVKLYKGSCNAVARSSPNSLYDENIATMEKGGSYNQNDATGFLRIKGLPLRVQAKVNRELGVNFFR